jgi:hypothetical protein
MDDMKWFFNKNSNMFGEGEKKKVNIGDNFEDLEAAAAGTGDQLLNRILTYIRKIEIKMEEKSETSKCQEDYEDLRNRMESAMTSNTDGTVVAPSGGDGVNKADRAKWDTNCKKTSELEKLLLLL